MLPSDAVDRDDRDDCAVGPGKSWTFPCGGELTLDDGDEVLGKDRLPDGSWPSGSCSCAREVLCISCLTPGERPYAKAVFNADQATLGSAIPWYIAGISFSTPKWWYTAIIAARTEYSTVNTTPSGISTNWPRKA